MCAGGTQPQSEVSSTNTQKVFPRAGYQNPDRFRWNVGNDELARAGGIGYLGLQVQGDDELAAVTILGDRVQPNHRRQNTGRRHDTPIAEVVPLLHVRLTSTGLG